MLISHQSDESPEELPREVQLWLAKGWTIIETKRRGIVLVGQKRMRGRSMLLIVGGIILLGLFHFGLFWPGMGLLFLIMAVVDYRFATSPPTKFFPAKGEKTRELER